MFERKRNAFTLIELVAVLVIMAIIALIVTPLVMNIIRKARVSADKRSIDAYGRSIELAIAGYLLDTGKFPTEVSQLTIEYSGNEVVCERAQINPDSSVYLAGCKVNNRDVTNYTYGSDKSPSYNAYEVGDEVTYNGVDYYVLKDSGTKESTVTLLKAEPLSVAEVNQFGGKGTENNHINKYTTVSVGEAYDIAGVGYGNVMYYSSENCGYINGSWVETQCKIDYEESDIKYIVDAWSRFKVPLGLQEARLIKKEEYEQMILTETYETPTEPGKRYVPMYDWQYGTNYEYWSESPYDDSTTEVWSVGESGGIGRSNVYGRDGCNGCGSGVHGTVRPVIVLDKSVL